MKIVSKEQQDAAASSALYGGAKGASIGLAVFIPAFYAASRQFPALSRVPPVQKSFLALVAALGAGATNAEFAYQKFIQSEWQGASAERLRADQHHEEEEWVAMSPSERLGRWAKGHRYQLVFGSWVASMLGSAGFIFARNPTQTFSQKLVQCRMVAQGATVAVLLASAALSRIEFEGENDPRDDPNQAWRQIVNQPEEQAPPLGSVHPTHSHPTK